MPLCIISLLWQGLQIPKYFKNTWIEVTCSGQRYLGQTKTMETEVHVETMRISQTHQQTVQ